MKRFFLVGLGCIALGILPVCSQGQTGDARYTGGILTAAAVPSNGTSCIQTITFGGTPTGGSFTLQFLGNTTGAISWSATNATLVSNISTALNALNTVGASGFTVAVGSMTAGIGTITATATTGGNLAVTVLPAITVANNSLTGTSPTVAVAITTAGVQADGRKSQKGALIIDQTNGNLYQNHGVPLAPNWVKVSAE